MRGGGVRRRGDTGARAAGRPAGRGVQAGAAELCTGSRRHRLAHRPGRCAGGAAALGHQRGGDREDRAGERRGSAAAADDRRQGAQHQVQLLRKLRLPAGWWRHRGGFHADRPAESRFEARAGARRRHPLGQRVLRLGCQRQRRPQHDPDVDRRSHRDPGRRRVRNLWVGCDRGRRQHHHPQEGRRRRGERLHRRARQGRPPD